MSLPRLRVCLGGSWKYGRTSPAWVWVLSAFFFCLPSCNRASTQSPGADQAPLSNVQQQQQQAPKEDSQSAVRLVPTSGAPPVSVRVDLALTPPEHERGLMFRKELLEHTGMLFVFPGEEIRRFWMKNTYVSLDMLFLDANRRVVGIEEKTVPHDLTGRGPNIPAMYVLEVPAGYCRRHGITVGSLAEFRNIQ